MILPDIQNTKPNVEIKLNRVGIKNYKLPISVLEKTQNIQHTIANVNCYVNLAADIKGISMSRLPIGLNKFSDRPLSGEIIEDIAEYIRLKSDAENTEITYKFPYFIKKNAPVSKEPGYFHVNVAFNGVKSKDDYMFRFWVETICSSSCPCSKEISQYGAHSQRSLIKIFCTPNNEQWVWIEDLIKIAQESASCEIFSVLKRPDEKKVTETTYENPMFVEDITRSCFEKLTNLNLKTFKIEVTNEESIHLHDAFSSIWV
jgi:GTP cyclohydrolase IB